MQSNAAIPREALINTLVSKYMHILGITKKPRIEIKNRLTPGWLGLCHGNGLIELLSTILEDQKTLERVVAHEMIHWRNFSVPGKQDDDPKGHGTSFEEGKAIVNAKMGPDFVTKNSDQTYAQSQNMQHYCLVVWPMASGNGYGWVWSASLTEKGKQMLAALKATLPGDRPPKVFMTTDERWLKGRKLGGKGATLDYSIGFSNTEIKEALEGIYNETKLPVGTFRVRNV